MARQVGGATIPPMAHGDPVSLPSARSSQLAGGRPRFGDVECEKKRFVGRTWSGH